MTNSTFQQEKTAVTTRGTTSPESAVSHAVAILDQLFPPPRPFAIRLWEGTELPANTAGACLVLRHPEALRRMFTPPIERSLGAAFIYGDFEVEGDIFAVFPAVDQLINRPLSFARGLSLGRHILALPHSKPERPIGRGPARLRGQRHSLARDRAAVRYHYDVGNDFYQLWLDRHMQYSCAYFQTGQEDLDTAQTQKLDHICRKLRLQPGERLLDLGCGWGGLAVYAAQNYGVRVLGITLSEEQAFYANQQITRAGLANQASVKLRDYREIGAEQFDKIVSVGMFEHVGRSRLPEYMARAYRHLKPGGLFLNHGISRRAPRKHRMNTEPELCCTQDMRPPARSLWQNFVEQKILGMQKGPSIGGFIQQFVFPDGELVPVSEINTVAEQAGFEVRDVENLREHYALTLHHWVRRLEAHREEAVKVAGEVTYRTWRLYMAASAHGFESGNINVNQALLAKTAYGGKSNIPLTRADLYAP